MRSIPNNRVDNIDQQNVVYQAEEARAVSSQKTWGVAIARLASGGEVEWTNQAFNRLAADFDLEPDQLAAEAARVAADGSRRLELVDSHSETFVVRVSFEAFPEGQVISLVPVPNDRMLLPTEDVADFDPPTRMDDLLRRNRDLEAFGLAIAHDLRAPLRAIRGYSLRLMRSGALEETEAGRDYVERVLRSIDRADAIMDALMALTRVIQRPLERRWVDFSELAQTVAADVADREPERNLDFQIEDNMRAFGDSPLLRILMENLIGNAVKFTRGRETASVSVEMQEDGTFVVTDNGVGFAENQSERLFEPFTRLHAAPEFEGYGLGLHIARRVVERHGGNIWASGRPNDGARFCFTLRPTRAVIERD